MSGDGEYVSGEDLGPEHLVLAIERTNEYLKHRLELLERLTPRERVPMIVMLTVEEIELVCELLTTIENAHAGARLLRFDLESHIDGYQEQLPS